MSEVRIAAEPRTEFGKGAARRTRRAGMVPAVLYGHGTDPQHIALPGHDLMLALKTPNVLLRVQGLSDGDELALPRDVQRDPIKGFLEHVDLLLVKLGEKVTVEIPINVTGEVVSGGTLTQPVVQIALEAEATHLPEAVDIDITGLPVGAQVLAKELDLPAGSVLQADDDTLILQITDATVSTEPVDTEAEEAEEGAEEEGETEEESTPSE